ncbi:arylcarboxylate reductase [Streptomyces armeniacus]|uniref:Arylcarboxylate reductase n=1 Tax=Streptomyces armeniacus TaxID=83291 RepID=A0A345XQ07_9ACTN|nr:arylcarboxylate reductase [Streptomyces armeniacus]AXK33723.1 arylcarboxylate reductase [Streptomyces armeniacus]QIQ28645.1 Nbc49 [Streptomyces sp.]
MTATDTPGAFSAESWLDTDLDAWTRKVLRRQFDPETGSPYWLKQVPELGFDPLEITRYDELSAFGNFDLSVLRDLDPVDMLPQAVERPLTGRVFESGGTTGAPCRVFYTERMAEVVAGWWQYSQETAGFEPGRTWLFAGPSGPHLIGSMLERVTRMSSSILYGIDLDPRWVKELIRGSRLNEMNQYVDHTSGQVIAILDSQQVDYLETTPAMLQVLLRKRPDLVGKLQGVGLSGTHITTKQYEDFKAAIAGDVICVRYGNTFGCGMGLPYEEGSGRLAYVSNYPQATHAVVDKDDPTRLVGYGELGRVRLTVLHEDLFLPNILDRDQAIRHDTGPQWPCDGVANVEPLTKSKSAPEGLY